MKKIFLILLLLPVVVVANVKGSGAGEEPILEPYVFGGPNILTQQIDQLDPDFVLQFFDEYSWLYELLIPEDFRINKPDRAKKSFLPHTLDSYDHYPHPVKVATSPLVDVLQKSINIVGKIKYVKIFGRRYTYKTNKKSKDEVKFRVKVHFKEASSKDKQLMQEKLLGAEKIWNDSRVETVFQYGFQFQVVDKPEDSHFSVYLVDSTRGPYDVKWAREWNDKTVAHELGHMMGLGDEYQTLTGTIDCLQSSLMCHSWYGKPMDHHHYFILRRLINYDGPTKYPTPGKDPWEEDYYE